MNSYHLETLADLLKVPVERRRDCMRELEYALAMYDLAYGDQPDLRPQFSMTWTDDGDKSVDMSVNGEPLLRLEVDGP